MRKQPPMVTPDPHLSSNPHFSVHFQEETKLPGNKYVEAGEEISYVQDTHSTERMNGSTRTEGQHGPTRIQVLDQHTPMEAQNELNRTEFQAEPTASEIQKEFIPIGTQSQPALGVLLDKNAPSVHQDESPIVAYKHGCLPGTSVNSTSVSVKPATNGSQAEPIQALRKSVAWNWVEKTRVVPRNVIGRRAHYREVQAICGNKTRSFRVGDTVCMYGELGGFWVAQILDLFQTHWDDPELSNALPPPSPMDKSNGTELMRCTLRWFYNPRDINEHSYRASRLPPIQYNEVFFSDYVEQSGFNSISVIEGKAWLFEDDLSMMSFLERPAADFYERADITRITRAFVNSNSVKLNVRKLNNGELDHLLRNPSFEQNLYSEGPKRLVRNE